MNQPFNGSNYSNIMVRLTELMQMVDQVTARLRHLEAKHNAILEVIGWFEKPAIPKDADEAKHAVANALWPDEPDPPEA